MPSKLYTKYVETVAKIPWLMKPLLKAKLFPRYWPPIRYGGTKEINDAMNKFAEEHGPFVICTFEGKKWNSADKTQEPWATWWRSMNEHRDRRINAMRARDSYRELLKETAEKIDNETKKRVNKSKDKPVPKKKGAVSPVRPASKGGGKVGTGTRNPRGNGRSGR